MTITVRIFLAGFLPLLIFLASFVNRKSYWQLGLFDWVCGACALLAVSVWVVLDSPILAILFSVIGDGFSSLPTFVKAWKHPETETGITYVVGLIAVLLVIPSMPNWSIENSAFQIYLIGANLILVVFTYRKKFI